jgi:hypothetical protein
MNAETARESLEITHSCRVSWSWRMVYVPAGKEASPALKAPEDVNVTAGPPWALAPHAAKVAIKTARTKNLLKNGFISCPFLFQLDTDEMTG